MDIFKEMVNFCIRVGLENNCTSLKRLSSLAYNDLKSYEIASYYKLNAISQVCGRLAQMKRQLKQGKKPKSPYVRKPYLVSCYGFNRSGILFAIPYKKGEHV